MMLESYAARDAVAGSEGAAPRGGFAGSDSCAKCHVDAYEIWQESLHHHAMETLADDLRDGAPATQDPNCVECHSVGFGFDSGYGSKKLADDLRWDTLNGFAGVGCESCHGPGAQHVASANVADIDRGGEHTCLVCHDSENDPNFHFGRKWPNIEHNNEYPCPARPSKSNGRGWALPFAWGCSPAATAKRIVQAVRAPSCLSR